MGENGLFSKKLVKSPTKHFPSSQHKPWVFQDPLAQNPIYWGCLEKGGKLKNKKEKKEKTDKLKKRTQAVVVCRNICYNIHT